MTARMIGHYPHRVAGHCGSGALRDLAHWAGLGWGGEPPGEGLVFGLGGSLSFAYLRSSRLRPSTYIVGRGADLELDVCRRLGIEVELRQTDDATLGWTWVVDELDAGRPVMLWADILDLPYLSVRLPNARHDVVAIGYDDVEEVVYLVDNDREDVQEVPMADLARARSSERFPSPARHATFRMRFPDSAPALRDVARDAARSTVSELRGGAPALAVLADLDGIRAFGLDGVQQFVADVTGWEATMDDDELASALATLPVFIEKAGTGGGLFRRLQADHCAEVARLTGDEAFARAGDCWADVADAWSEVARAAATGPEAVAHAATTLPGLEHRAVDMLEAAAT